MASSCLSRKISLSLHQKVVAAQLPSLFCVNLHLFFYSVGIFFSCLMQIRFYFVLQGDCKILGLVLAHLVPELFSRSVEKRAVHHSIS